MLRNKIENYIEILETQNKKLHSKLTDSEHIGKNNEAAESKFNTTAAFISVLKTMLMETTNEQKE